MNQDGDAQRYGGLTAIKKDETIFAAYDKAEMRKAKIMVVANSEFLYTSKSLFWPDVIMLAAVDLGLLQSVSLGGGGFWTSRILVTPPAHNQRSNHVCLHSGKDCTLSL